MLRTSHDITGSPGEYPEDNGEKQSIKAFTLIEVLIALIVLAIAFTALFETTRSNVMSSTVIKKSLVSNWVALNAFATIELGLSSKPQPGSDIEGDETMLGIDWHWTASTDEKIVSSSSLERVTITVSEDGTPYQHVVGFIK